MRLITGSAVVICVLAAAAERPALKTFHDEKYGVTFQYPGQWISGPDNRFDLVSAIVSRDPKDEGKELRGQVGLFPGQYDRPYAGTDLAGIQFLYNVIPMSTAAGCRKPLEDEAQGRKNSLDERTMHGIAYDHYSFAGAWTGHYGSGDLFSTFRGGNCYLFEESIHTISMDNTPMLSNGERKQLFRELNKVMLSVRIEGAL